MADKFAFIFPGQGSQSLGMLADIAKEFNEIEEIFKSASEILGYDLWKICQEGPDTKLNQTEITQPALLAGSFGLWTILKKRKPLTPDYVAGHSLGEYSALVCTNSLKFEDGIKLVAARGKFMQEAVAIGSGAMAAIVGLSDEVVRAICKRAAENDVLTPANYNSIGQVVIAGNLAAVHRAIEIAKQEGATLAILLPVSVPSHCALMKPAADRLAEVLQGIQFAVPEIPVLNNADVAIYESTDQIRLGLVHQLYQAVRWVEIIQKLESLQVRRFIECGAGKVLNGLNKRIDSTLTTLSLSNIKDLLELIKE